MNKIIQYILNLFRIKKEAKIPENPGLLSSPEDNRDIPMEAVSKEENPKPDEYKIPYKLTIGNQENNPYCVGFACASLKEYLERKEGNYIQFDAKWIYDRCKEIDGMPNVQGTYFRAGLKVLKNIGAKPLNGKDEDIPKYKIGGYVKIKGDFDSIKRAIYEYGAILIGFIGSNNGWKTAIIRPAANNESQWGHATVGVGYVIKFVDGQNSWGENWGDKGLFKFAKDYPVIECWGILTDLPNDWQELLPNPKKKPKFRFERDLYYGLKNDDVVVLQDCLKWLGVLSEEITSTGYFGNATVSAVKIFQQRYGIQPVFGFVGSLTRKKLNEIFI